MTAVQDSGLSEEHSEAEWTLEPTQGHVFDATSPREKVTLQAGHRFFHTKIDTLVQRSRYFQDLFYGELPVEKQQDGSIFLDVDPNVFEHLLRYMRHGLFPLAFSQKDGHDYKLYADILKEALKFQLPLLCDWLKGEYYHKCVSWRVSSKVQNMEDGIFAADNSYSTIQFLPFKELERKIYICPREIPSHRDRPERCGRACFRALGNNEPAYEKEKVTTACLLVEKKYEINREWMMDSRYVHTFFFDLSATERFLIEHVLVQSS